MSSSKRKGEGPPNKRATAQTTEVGYLAQIFAFGWAADGKLGIGNTSNPKNHPHPHPIFSLHWKGVEDAQLKQAACGDKHSLFLLNDEDGSIYSCGSGSLGQLGRSEMSVEEWTPRRIQDGENKERCIQVAAGHATSFAVNQLGDVYAWGSNRYGALGVEETEGDEKIDDKASIYPIPTYIKGLASIAITHLSTMGQHVLALAQDRRLYAWGRNDSGQCGVGRTCHHISRPTEVEFLVNEKPILIAAGMEHSIALVEVERTPTKRERVIYTWGKPANHRLGGADPKRHYCPRENRSFSALQTKKKIEIRQIAAGGMHNLAITGMGMLWAWGGGGYGQLGNGHLWDKMDPISVPEITSVKTIVAGARHSLAIRDNGEVWGWGWNGFGELGMGDVDVKLQPHCLFAFKRSKVTQVYAGERHSIVVTKGTAIRASEEEDYKPYLRMLDEGEGSPRVKEELKRVMQSEGLDPAFLDNRFGYVPGQPGMTDEDITVQEEKYGMPWCLDTWSKSKFLAVCSWPTRYTCNGCKMKQICMACARKCHKSHGLIVHMTSKKKGDRCDCSVSKTCVCRWSELRHEFGKHAQPEGEYILGKQLRGFLEELRYGLTFNAEDLEAAYTELCLSRQDDGGGGGGGDLMKIIDEARIPWSAFEIFYEDWFGEKDAVGKSLPGEEGDEEREGGVEEGK